MDEVSYRKNIETNKGAKNSKMFYSFLKWRSLFFIKNSWEHFRKFLENIDQVLKFDKIIIIKSIPYSYGASSKSKTII